ARRYVCTWPSRWPPACTKFCSLGKPFTATRNPSTAGASGCSATPWCTWRCCSSPWSLTYEYNDDKGTSMHEGQRAPVTTERADSDRLPIRAEGLVKRFGDVEAVAGASFEVQRGEVFGLLGPNGAGKTTTIRILTTLLLPTAGVAEVAGYNVVTHPGEVRRRIGLVFQEPSLDVSLTARENLFFHARLYGMDPADANARIDQMLDLVELSHRASHLVKTFSGGMRRRLEVARALLHRPTVLFLDEPTTGLDPQTRARIWEYVHELRTRQGTTVLMTTHYMDEAEHCDRIAI